MSASSSSADLANSVHAPPAVKDAEPAEVTLPGHADIDDEFLGSSQAGELEMISPTRQVN